MIDQTASDEHVVSPAPVPPGLGEDLDVTLTGWPRQDSLELGPFPGAVPCARLHTRHVLWEWGLSGLSNGAELAVSELITNAVRASHAIDVARVRLWLLANEAQVLVLVWDASPHAPEPMDADPQAEGGRGLLLISAVSVSWAWYRTPAVGGKVVWALIGAQT